MNGYGWAGGGGGLTARTRDRTQEHADINMLFRALQGSHGLHSDTLHLYAS